VSDAFRQYGCGTPHAVASADATCNQPLGYLGYLSGCLTLLLCCILLLLLLLQAPRLVTYGRRQPLAQT
jgi:hypothetical protein